MYNRCVRLGTVGGIGESVSRKLARLKRQAGFARMTNSRAAMLSLKTEVHSVNPYRPRVDRMDFGLFTRCRRRAGKTSPGRVTLLFGQAVGPDLGGAQVDAVHRPVHVWHQGKVGYSGDLDHLC